MARLSTRLNACERDLNGTQAAIRAGYSPKTARFIGCENLTKPNIEAAIAEAQAEKAKRIEVTVDAVVAELARIGFVDMGDYVTIADAGDPRQARRGESVGPNCATEPHLMLFT